VQIEDPQVDRSGAPEFELSSDEHAVSSDLISGDRWGSVYSAELLMKLASVVREKCAADAPRVSATCPVIIF